jgi:hypothetical protein
MLAILASHLFESFHTAAQQNMLFNDSAADCDKQRAARGLCLLEFILPFSGPTAHDDWRSLLLHCCRTPQSMLPVAWRASQGYVPWTMLDLVLPRLARLDVSALGRQGMSFVA